MNAIISQKRDAQGVGEHNNQPKQGTKAQRMAMSVRAVTVTTAEARAMVAAYAAVRAVSEGIPRYSDGCPGF